MMNMKILGTCLSAVCLLYSADVMGDGEESVRYSAPKLSSLVSQDDYEQLRQLLGDFWAKEGENDPDLNVVNIASGVRLKEDYYKAIYRSLNRLNKALKKRTLSTEEVHDLLSKIVPILYRLLGLPYKTLEEYLENLKKKKKYKGTDEEKLLLVIITDICKHMRGFGNGQFRKNKMKHVGGEYNEGPSRPGSRVRFGAPDVNKKQKSELEPMDGYAGNLKITEQYSADADEKLSESDEM